LLSFFLIIFLNFFSGIIKACASFGIKAV
jgi:hypothetical protein